MCAKAADPCAWRRPGEVQPGLATTVPSTGHGEWMWPRGPFAEREVLIDKRMCLQEQELRLVL